MLRPLIVDILGLLLPLCGGAVAFFAGQSLHRQPRALRVLIVALAAGIVVCGGASLVGLAPNELDPALSRAGGATVLLSWAALLLLGVAWVSPGRRLSSTFLASLVAIATCLLLIESSGSLWWRYGAHEMWQRTPDAQGRLQQSSGLTCSPAAAAMLLHRYGISASEGEMAYLAGTSLFGTDAYAAARAVHRKVQDHGWQALSRRSSYEERVHRGQPFLAHVQGPYLGHALLVERMFPEHVEVLDPLDGLPQRLSRVEFERVWDGTAVEIIQSAE